MTEDNSAILRRLWTLLPTSWRHQFWTLAGPRWQSAYARSMIARPAESRPTDPRAPLVVAGLFNTASGIGEGARTTYRALQAAGLDPIAVDLSAPFAPVDLNTDIPCQPMPSEQEGTLILQLNGPETMSAMQHLGLRRGRNWYTIGYWAWELPNFPIGWETAFKYLSEIWTISDFAAAALRQHPAAPKISVFGHAISPPQNLQTDRARFGWDDAFVFLTMADSMSSFERKNPFATIRAFQHAFGDSPAHKLVIKTRNIDRHEAARQALEQAIGDAKNIALLDASLSEPELWLLLNSADALISLHRSEGFGLTLAEAMALSKPVICTNWSGNTDFTHAGSAALVDYSLIPCVDPYGVYQIEDTKWASADESHAAKLMKQVAEDESFRQRLGRSGKETISELASLENVGARMASHLECIPKSLMR